MRSRKGRRSLIFDNWRAHDKHVLKVLLWSKNRGNPHRQRLCASISCTGSSYFRSSSAAKKRIAFRDHFEAFELPSKGETLLLRILSSNHCKNSVARLFRRKSVLNTEGWFLNLPHEKKTTIPKRSYACVFIQLEIDLESEGLSPWGSLSPDWKYRSHIHIRRCNHDMETIIMIQDDTKWNSNRCTNAVEWHNHNHQYFCFLLRYLNLLHKYIWTLVNSETRKYSFDQGKMKSAIFHQTLTETRCNLSWIFSDKRNGVWRNINIS